MLELLAFIALAVLPVLYVFACFHWAFKALDWWESKNTRR